MQRGDAGHTHMTISPLFTLTPPWHTNPSHNNSAGHLAYATILAQLVSSDV